MRLAAAFIAVSAAMLLGVQAATIDRRDGTNSQWTFYNVDSFTSCGKFVHDSDFSVALDPTQYNNGANCFRSVTLTSGGKTAVAVVNDECVTCPPGGLDLTTGLFQFFQPLSAGLIHGNWSFN